MMAAMPAGLAYPVPVGGGVAAQLVRQEPGELRQLVLVPANHTAKLYGHVHSLRKAAAARAAAAAARGVATVESHLAVSP